MVPGRLANRHPSISPYETLATQDRPIALAVGSDRLFSLLADVVGRPGLATDPRFLTNADRVRNRSQLTDELEAVLASRSAADWVRDLRAVGVPAGLVNNIAEAFEESSALRLAPVLDTLRSDGSHIPTVRSPLDLSRTPVVNRRAPPALGEHDDEVRRWIAESAYEHHETAGGPSTESTL